jgi:adiponectin receptor
MARRRTRQSSASALSKNLDTLSEDVSSELSKPAHIGTHMSVEGFARYPYIETGYRANYGLCDCLLSTFTFHNESANIWTHIIPFILEVIYLIYSIEQCLSDLPFGAFVSCWTGILGLLICLGSSILYHIGGALPQATHDFLLQVDMSGVIFNAVGLTICWIYFGLVHMNEQLMVAYFFFLGIVTIVGMTMASMSGHPEYGLKLRSLGISSFLLLNLIPIIHLLCIVPQDLFDIGIWFLFAYPMVGAGMFFYLSKIPECYTPYFVDNLSITSHTIWHIFVAGQNFSCLRAILLLGANYKLKYMS